MEENKVEINLAHNDMGPTNVVFSLDNEGMHADVWISPEDFINLLELELDSDLHCLDHNQQDRLLAFCNSVIYEHQNRWMAQRLCDKCSKNFTCEEDCAEYTKAWNGGVNIAKTSRD